MSNNNQHKRGYKHAAYFGWIPEEWKFDEIGDKLDLLSGYAFESEKYSNEGIRLLRGANIKRGDTDWLENNTTFWKEISPELERYWLSEGDLVIAMDGSLVGKSYAQITKQDLPCLLLQRVARIRSTKIDLTYLKFLIGSNYFIRYCDGVKTVTAIPHISSYDIKKFKVPLPGIDEQRQIAAILSTWDEAITKTQQLITQLQQRNKGLIQQLLSGMKRLDGFEEEWKRAHIYEIANEVSLKNREDKQLTVLSCTKYAGLVPSLEYFGRRVFGSDTSTYKIVPKDHFAYATNHIEEGSIGYQDIFEEALISPMYTVFKTSVEVNDDFLYKLLKSHHYIHQYCKRMEGSIDRRGGLRWDDFSKIPVRLPQYKEQTAIASIINKAVEEVKLQQQHLVALQQQKKGLMQKLLTGEVRVKI